MACVNVRQGLLVIDQSDYCEDTRTNGSSCCPCVNLNRAIITEHAGEWHAVLTVFVDNICFNLVFCEHQIVCDDASSFLPRSCSRRYYNVSVHI
jgi:hypothetical protein